MPPKKHKIKTRSHAQAAAAAVTSTPAAPVETVRVLFQAGILDPLQLSGDYADIIDALANGHYKSVKFKKLKGYDNVYAARVNKSDRLLFTFEVIDGKRYLVLIDVVDNHAYDDSAILKPGGLEQFKIKYKHAIHASAHVTASTSAASSERDSSDDDDDENFSDVDIDKDPCLSSFQSSNQENKPVELWPGVFFKDKFNALSPEQKLLQEQGFPKLCIGPAGSGKSCAAFVEMEKALAAIKQMAEDNPDFDISTIPPVAYVTQSPILLRQMKKEWEEMHPHSTIVPIQFQTYDDFVLEQDPTLKGKQVGDEHFKAWLKGYLTSARKMPSAQKTSTASFITTLDPDDKNSALFEELEIIAGCKTPTDYFKLGNRECHFHTKDEKSIIFKLYEDYIKYLRSTDNYDPRLLTIAAIKPRNFATIVDEAHDLSQRELLTLSAGTIDNSICLLMDPYQRLSRRIPTIPFVEKYFSALGKENATHKLTSSIRCPKIMTDIATSLISARNICATGTPIKDADTTITSAAIQKITTGEAHIVNPDDISAFTDMLDKLRELAKNELVVIITPEEHRKEAERKFPGFLILNPSEAKGMEYHTVVMFRCFTGQKLAALNQTLAQNQDAKAPTNRSKNADTHVDTCAIDELYVSTTRATDGIYLVDTETKNNRYLFAPIKRIVAAAKTEQLTTADTVSASTANRNTHRLEIIENLILTNKPRQIAYAKHLYLVEDKIGDEASFNALLISMQTVNSPSAAPPLSAAATPVVSAVTATPTAAAPVKPAASSRQKTAASGQSASTQVATSSNNPGTGLNSKLSGGVQDLLKNFTPMLQDVLSKKD